MRKKFVDFVLIPHVSGITERGQPMTTQPDSELSSGGRSESSQVFGTHHEGNVSNR